MAAMNHARFTAFLTDAERNDLLRIAALLNIDESACVAEALRKFIIWYAPMLKAQKHMTRGMKN
jgi:hypothetical protein